MKKLGEIPLSSAGFDLVVRDDGLVLVSGWGPEWTNVEAINLDTNQSLGTFASIWGKSLVQQTPDGRRLFVSSQGVLPGTLEAIVLPRVDRSAGVKLVGEPVIAKAPGSDKALLGGGFIITPDGKWLLCRAGTVLQLSGEQDQDMRLHSSIVPHLSASVDPLGKAVYLLGRDGLLHRYSYPEFLPTGRWKLELTAYRMIIDGKNGLLYVAGIDPRSISDRPRAKGHGDIHAFALKDLPKEKKNE
jgi:hypothetical protein